MDKANERIPGYSYYALSLLMFVYVMNFLDRQIIYILFPSIKAEMAFSDLQLALLGGTSFAIFYTLLGIPFGRLADKGSRTKLIAFGLAVWSLFSALTGFADSFWTIFACRVMVGVGEATLGPAAISLLADYFPPTKRATVTSIYSMGIAIGAGLAAIFGGYLSQIGWREAFYIVGFPGLIFAVFVFFLREPERTTQTALEENFSSSDWKKLISNKAFVMLCLGYAFLGLATNNISIWGATYLNRLYEIPIPTIGYWLGILTLAAGVPATLSGGAIADWFRKRRRGGRMYFGAILSTVSLCLWLVILFSNNFYLIIPAGLILLFSALAWLGAAAADATEISGANLRGLAVAIYFFTVNIFAYIIGANLIGKLNDIFGATANPQMMRYALLVCPISCALSVICLVIGGKSLDKVN
jgi:MFS family permease